MGGAGVGRAQNIRATCAAADGWGADAAFASTAECVNCGRQRLHLAVCWRVQPPTGDAKTYNRRCSLKRGDLRRQRWAVKNDGPARPGGDEEGLQLPHMVADSAVPQTPKIRR